MKLRALTDELLGNNLFALLLKRTVRPLYKSKDIFERNQNPFYKSFEQTMHLQCLADVIYDDCDVIHKSKRIVHALQFQFWNFNFNLAD